VVGEYRDGLEAHRVKSIPAHSEIARHQDSIASAHNALLDRELDEDIHRPQVDHAGFVHGDPVM